MSTINVTNLSGRGGATPNLPDGANVTGVVTATSFDGSLKTTGTPTLGLGVTINSSGINVSGVLTATTLYGNGANLTGVGESIAPWHYNPDINDQLVGAETGIGITFNKRVLAGSGTATIKIVNAGVAGTTIQSWGVSSCTFNVTQFTMGSLVSPLTVDQTYQLDIPEGFIVDSNETSYAGTAYTFAVMPAEPKLFTWGDNSQGVYGINLADTIFRSSPVQLPGTTWSKVTTSYYSALGSKTDGTLWSWGYAAKGQLGNNAVASRSSPTQLPGTTWSSVHASGRNFSFGVKTDGTLWSWGYNTDGQLGKNNRTLYSSPVQVGSDTTWGKTETDGHILISAHRNGASFIKSDGTLWAMGHGNRGILGQNNNTSYSSPVQIPGTTWRSVSNNMRISHATRTDGTLWSWGYNEYGELGNNLSGANGSRSSPVQVPGTSWKYIASAQYGVIATKTDGTMWVWGDNEYGMLGLNEAESKQYSSPTQLPGTTWDRVGNGRLTYYATKTDGTLWSWGRGYRGQLGDNAEVDRSSPVQIGSETDWTVGPISSCYGYTGFALMSDNTP